MKERIEAAIDTIDIALRNANVNLPMQGRDTPEDRKRLEAAFEDLEGLKNYFFFPGVKG